MDTVYKYCGEYGLKVLSDLELKITPPNEFNDPFEFTPKYVCSDPDGFATWTLDGNLNGLYERQCSKGLFRGNFQEFKEKAGTHRPQMIKELVRVWPTAAADTVKVILDKSSEFKAVLCMSEQRDSILMWGHYCHKLLGLVIGFDKSSAIFQQEKGLRPTVYVKERVVFDLCWLYGVPELLKNYEEQIIYSKSIAWEYEKELRQIFTPPSSSLSPKPLKDGTLGYFRRFQPKDIVSVTLGPRCSSELENGVMEILKKPEFSHVKLDRAVLHKDDFVLEFEPILHR